MNTLNNKIFIIDEDGFKMLQGGIKSLENKIEADNKGKTLENYYLDTDGACKLLKVSSRTLYNWRVQGKIKYSKPGNKIIFRFKDLEQFVDSRLL